MAKQKISNKEQVSEYILKLENPISEIVCFLRKIILDIDSEISEHIKWNSVSFYFSGEMKSFDPKEYQRDLLVLNIHKKESVLLIFPTGNKINDAPGFLEGNYPDGRKIAQIKNLKEAENRKNDLQNVIKDWLSKIEK